MPVGVEVACWTLNRTIRVRFPAYPHRAWALCWQGGKRSLRTSRYPCRGRLCTLKTPSCSWRWVPGRNLETGYLPRHYIAEIPLNVTLNHNQPTNQPSNEIVTLTLIFVNDKNSFFPFVAAGKMKLHKYFLFSYKYQNFDVKLCKHDRLEYREDIHPAKHSILLVLKGENAYSKWDICPFCGLYTI